MSFGQNSRFLPMETQVSSFAFGRGRCKRVAFGCKPSTEVSRDMTNTLLALIFDRELWVGLHPNASLIPGASRQ
jgi:hypothetical protein